MYISTNQENSVYKYFQGWLVVGTSCQIRGPNLITDTHHAENQSPQVVL